MHTNMKSAPERGRLSATGAAIGCVGCAIITASSVYTALKMGALPWPTIFTSITALVLLRACGRTSLNEANITQIIMSAGSMVAGGLAFTIPGAWMLGLADQMSWPQMLAVALAGTLLGLVCTALIRKKFVEESDLEYPIGTAAAETLMASRAGGATGRRLFGSMAAAGLWCILRDVAGIVPAMLCGLSIPGVSFAIYNSPMLASVGFLVGGTAVAFWLAGGLVANLGIIAGGSNLGLWSIADAQGIVSSLGMGLMMGSGLGVLVRDILPKARSLWKTQRRKADDALPGCAGNNPCRNPQRTDARRQGHLDAEALALFAATAALLACLGIGLNPLMCIALVGLTFVASVMSAQSVGQTGIDPMEIFGLIVLLAIAALGESDQVRLFLIAGVVAVACGLAGDVMSDFKTGQIIGTSPRAMWAGQAIGALLGAVASVTVMALLLAAYGPEAFGPGKDFAATQASVVATMVSGIPSTGSFVIGLAVGIALYCLGIPAMMLGLGVYLPLHMTLTASLGALIKLVYDRIFLRRTPGSAQSGGENALRHEENGTLIASGVLGGESIVGVLIALASVASAMLG